MTAIFEMGIADIRSGIADGDFTAKEVAETFIARVSAAKPLNAFLVETPEHALAAAEATDKAKAAGETLGKMAGVPIGMKDLFCTEGVATTAASHILEGFVPQYESTVSSNLFKAGAGMLGKLNMDQFAMGSSNETSAFGNVISPWRRNDGGNSDLTPGGSSGGSAAVVSGRIAPAATGTAIMLEAMAGFDAKDSTSLNLPVPDWEAALSSNLAGKKIGIPKEYRVENMPPEIDALWQQGIEMLKDAGATIVDVSLPHTKYALPAYYIIAPAEASSNLSRYDGVRYGLRDLPDGAGLQDMYAATREAGFGPEVKRRIMIGTYVLSAGYYDAYYTQAQKVRTLISQDFDKAWNSCDLLLTPTAPSAAFGLGEKMDDPLAMYLNDVFTVPSSLAGLPAMSVPAGLDGKGLPLGLQIIGKALDEQSVFNAGLAIEERAGFVAKPEQWW